MPDILGLGFANIDVIAHVEDAFLQGYGFQKGMSYYLDNAKASEILNQLKNPIYVPGGSVANSMLCLGVLGLDARLISRLGQDKYADMVRKHFDKFKVKFVGGIDTEGRETKKCIIMVTPDAQRTFVPPDGAANYFSNSDFDTSLLTSAKIVFIEGFTWRKDAPRKTIIDAAKKVKAQGQAKIAFTLPDLDTMSQHREEILKFVREYVDLLFANDEEILFLINEKDIAAAEKTIQDLCPVVAMTKGEKGSIIFSHNQKILVDRIQPRKLVDTTGAGDAYAAGFLYGYIKGFDLSHCGHIGSLVASEIITVDGGTPPLNLAEIVESFLEQQQISASDAA